MNIVETVSLIIAPLITTFSALIAPLFACNEFIFIFHAIIIALFAIGSVRLGRGALTAFMATCWILGNLFVIKEATIFGLHVVTSDSFAIGANIAITLLDSYYGKRAAKNGIKIGFYIALFFVLMSTIHLLYIPNSFDISHTHFVVLLSRMTRIVGASFLVSAISMNLNLFLFDFLKKKFGQNYFSLCSFLSLTISQFVDTALFAYIALYGNVHSIVEIIIFSSLMKAIAIGISVPCVSLAKKFILKPKEL
ncbi:queuosine precursor transporter [Candidatus Babeliales bacterium]|nr:queuosine precursor transporter [Candidatus Babeliales bacterium]